MELEEGLDLGMNAYEKCLEKCLRVWILQPNGLCSKPSPVSCQMCPGGEAEHYQMDEPGMQRPVDGTISLCWGDGSVNNMLASQTQ